MPRPRPPHLHRETSRHGQPVWYVRFGRGRRIRIHAEFGTPEFDAEYQAAIAGTPRPVKGASAAGSLAWLIARYRDSSNWTGLSLATRRQREGIFRQIIESAGTKPYARVDAATITAGRDRRSATPFQARHFLDTMRGLFAWAKESGFVKVDPAASVGYPLLKSGEGFPIWTEDDVAAYQARWPLGTRQGVWLAVLLYTGLRRGDAVRLGRQHVRDGIARLKTEKTATPVAIRLLPPLVAALDAGPVGDLAYICGANGKPLTKESFGNDFGEACRKAGINKSAHGLRKLAATTMAYNGATVAELNAVFGWTGAKMASHYTQTADRERLALGAAEKLLNNSETSIPAPEGKVRASGEKA
jgi:integrase